MKIDDEAIRKVRIDAGRNWAYLTKDGGFTYTANADFCRDFIFSVCEHLDKLEKEISRLKPFEEAYDNVCGELALLKDKANDTHH